MAPAATARVTAAELSWASPWSSKTATDWPCRLMCPVRARPRFWEKEKFTTPFATVPIVSQAESLTGAIAFVVANDGERAHGDLLETASN